MTAVYRTHRLGNNDGKRAQHGVLGADAPKEPAELCCPIGHDPLTTTRMGVGL